MKMTPKQWEYLKEACYCAIEYEKSYLDAIHNTDDKAAKKVSIKWINRWKRLIKKINTPRL